MNKISITVILLLLTACGTQGEPGPEGAQGIRGSGGFRGPSGMRGHSIVSQQIPSAPSCASGGSTLLIATDSNEDGILDSGDANIQSMTICNGSNGADGISPSYTPAIILDPCGASGGQDEVMLKLSSGVILSSFSDNVAGYNTRFSILHAGQSYLTTDGSQCYFSLDYGGNVTGEHY